MTHYERILALQRALADAVQEAQNWKEDYLEMHDRAVRYMRALEQIRMSSDKGTWAEQISTDTLREP